MSLRAPVGRRPPGRRERLWLELFAESLENLPDGFRPDYEGDTAEYYSAAGGCHFQSSLAAVQ